MNRKRRAPKGIPALDQAFAKMCRAAMERLDSMSTIEREEALRLNVSVKSLAPKVPEWALGLFQAGGRALMKEHWRRVSAGMAGTEARESKRARWREVARRLDSMMDEPEERKARAAIIALRLQKRGMTVKPATVYKALAPRRP